MQNFFKYFLKPSRELKRYFANTTWILFEKLIRTFAYFIIGIWIVRYLGPTEYGLLAYAQSIIYFFIGVASLGLDEIVVRELVANEDKSKKLLGTALILKLSASVLILSCLSILIYFFGNSGKASYMIIILSFSILFLSTAVANFYFQYAVMLKYTSIANIIAVILTSLLKIFLILYEYDVIYFAIILSLEAFLLSILLAYFLQTKAKISLFSLSFDKKLAINLLKDSWPLIFIGIFINIYLKVDQIMITQLIGAAENGKYSAALLLSEGFYFIPMVICASVFPKILQAKNNYELYDLRLRRLYFLMFWIAVIIAVLITLLSRFLILSFFGSEFEDSISVLIIHIWTCIFIFLGVANSKYLISENLQSYYFIYTFIGAISNIILNFYFIKNFGITGAAWSSLISYALASHLCLVLFSKTRNSFFRINKSILYFK